MFSAYLNECIDAANYCVNREEKICDICCHRGHCWWVTNGIDVYYYHNTFKRGCPNDCPKDCHECSINI